MNNPCDDCKLKDWHSEQSKCIDKKEYKIYQEGRMEGISECLDIIKNSYRMDAIEKIEKLKEEYNMNERELFDALAESCPNELKKHDAKLRAAAIDEYKKALLNNDAIDKSVVRRVAEQLKEPSHE